jgi:acyl-CoA synthetase (AMP-forming)/AMP-acid ligase II
MPRPTILEHVKCQTGPNQELAIHSPSLLTGYITRNNQHAQFFDPKVNGWFETTDRVRIADHQLEVLGRLSNVVKVSGEQVDLTKLSNIFRKIAPQQDAIVFAIPDDRTGHRVVLVSLSAVDESRLNLLREQFNREVMPFERIQEIRIVEQFPRTALGKLATEELRNLLG